jgi:hypothetical protein
VVRVRIFRSYGHGYRTRLRAETLALRRAGTGHEKERGDATSLDGGS